MFRYGLSCITILLICSIPVLGQVQPEGYIDPENFDAKRLEHYTKKMIDSVRQKQGLKPLFNDSILYLAAKDHAQYLREKPQIGHGQENERKATSQKRIGFYGGDFWGTGENVARIFVHRWMILASGKTGQVRTYRQAAFELTQNWAKSPLHYRNMTHPDFDITGLAISYNPNNDAVSAVQTFGMVRESYTPNHTGESKNCRKRLVRRIK